MDYLQGLSDGEYQKEVWVKKVYPPGVQYDDLNLAIHFFFDDTPLATNADAAIGVFLYDQAEAALVSQVVRELDALFDEYGTNLSDAEYIAKPEWQSVLASAKYALSEIVKK